MQAADLKWAIDLRRMFWSEDMSHEITEQIIQAHREKQEKKRRLLREAEASSGDLLSVHKQPSVEGEGSEDVVEGVEVGEPMVAKEALLSNRTGVLEEAISSLPREERLGGRHRQEFLIRRSSRSGSSTRFPPPPPPPDRAFHYEVITHYRHIDHGFEVSSNATGLRPRFAGLSPVRPAGSNGRTLDVSDSNPGFGAGDTNAQTDIPHTGGNPAVRQNEEQVTATVTAPLNPSFSPPNPVQHRMIIEAPTIERKVITDCQHLFSH
ncbi:hypothetical protein ABEF95_003768 [Exophiala dermatitidis]